MNCVWFFNEQASDLLQHVAVILEIIAIYLVFRDRKVYDADIGHHQRAAVSMFGTAMPKTNRAPQFRSALIVGGVAVTFELYQLATQYLGCSL